MLVSWRGGRADIRPILCRRSCLLAVCLFPRHEVLAGERKSSRQRSGIRYHRYSFTKICRMAGF